MVRLSNQNSKMGKIISVSLTHKTCNPSAPCLKTCYNNKAWIQYREVRECYTYNTTLYENNPETFFIDIQNQLTKKRKPGHFRYHVSGDIPDTNYLHGMFNTAIALPSWNFLCFTKKYTLINTTLDIIESVPPNLNIIFSAWEHYPMENPYALPVAYHLNPDDPDPRIPPNATMCNKRCDECFHCWSLKPTESIILPHH